MYKHPEIDYTPEHPSLKNYDVKTEERIIMNLQNMGYTAFPDGTPFEFSAGYFSRWRKKVSRMAKKAANQAKKAGGALAKAAKKHGKRAAKSAHKHAKSATKSAKKKAKGTSFFKGMMRKSRMKKAFKHLIPMEDLDKKEKELVRKRDISTYWRMACKKEGIDTAEATGMNELSKEYESAQKQAHEKCMSIHAPVINDIGKKYGVSQKKINPYCDPNAHDIEYLRKHCGADWKSGKEKAAAKKAKADAKAKKAAQAKEDAELARQQELAINSVVLNNNYKTIADKFFVNKTSYKQWDIWHPSLRGLDKTAPTSIEYYQSKSMVGWGGQEETIYNNGAPIGYYIRAYKPKDVVEAYKNEGKKLHYFRLPPEIIFGGYKDINKEGDLLICETFPTLTKTKHASDLQGKEPVPVKDVWKSYYNDKHNMPIELTSNPGAMWDRKNEGDPTGDKTAMQWWELYKNNKFADWD